MEEKEFLVTLRVRVRAESADGACRNVRDALLGNDDVCDVEAAQDAIDFDTLTTTAEPA